MAASDAPKVGDYIAYYVAEEVSPRHGTVEALATDDFGYPLLMVCQHAQTDDEDYVTVPVRPCNAWIA